MQEAQHKPIHSYTISVIGLGYIGLPTAAILASRKIRVIGVDINAHAVDTINRGETHFSEPELDIIVRSVVADGYLQATTQPNPADVFIIAVPTPINPQKQADLSYIQAACQSIAPVLQTGNLIILESTSPVGTTEQIATWLAQQCPSLTFPHTHGESSDIRIAYCPERVLPGRILHELIINDRIIGGITPACSQAALQLYKTFVEGECIQTSAPLAELCKLTENSFRDVNIAFANELSMICDHLNLNVWELIKLANHHPRVNILQPGPGVGGHCIAVDPWFIVNSAPEQAKLIATARQVNDSKPLWVVQKVQQAIHIYLQNNPTKTQRDITIACLGLTFKADVDDLRESPALQIVKQLVALHPGPVRVVEPHIQHLPRDLASKTSLYDLAEAIKESDIVLLLVDHKLFKAYQIEQLNNALIIDVRGIWVTTCN